MFNTFEESASDPKRFQSRGHSLRSAILTYLEIRPYFSCPPSLFSFYILFSFPFVTFFFGSFLFFSLSRFFSPHSSTPSSCVDVLYHRPLFIIVLFFFISFACCSLVIVFSLRFSCCVLDLASFFPLSFHPHSFSLIIIKEDSTNMMKKKR